MTVALINMIMLSLFLLISHSYISLGKRMSAFSFLIFCHAFLQLGNTNSYVAVGTFNMDKVVCKSPSPTQDQPSVAIKTCNVSVPLCDTFHQDH